MVVRLHREQSLEEQAVIDFARDRLAAYKVPTRVFFTEQALPRNATNKVLKRELKGLLRLYRADTRWPPGPRRQQG